MSSQPSSSREFWLLASSLSSADGPPGSSACGGDGASEGAAGRITIGILTCSIARDAYPKANAQATDRTTTSHRSRRRFLARRRFSSAFASPGLTRETLAPFLCPVQLSSRGSASSIVSTIMGRGLSELQKSILRLAYHNRLERLDKIAKKTDPGSHEHLVLTRGVESPDLYYAEVLREHFGWE